LGVRIAVACLFFVLAASMLVLEQPGTVHGHVYSWRCGNGPLLGQGTPCDMPVSDIRIRFSRDDNSKSVTTTTDTNGSYSITLPAGHYTVTREWVGGSLTMDAGPAKVWVRPFISVTIDYAVRGGWGLSSG
jgi:hypothetical protein